MKKFALSLLLPLVLAPALSQAATCATCPQENCAQGAGFPHVKNYAELERYIAEGKTIVLDIYTNWCGACKQMIPVLQELSGKHSDVIFLRHNAEQDSSIKEKFGIKFYPTYILINKQGMASVEVGGMSKNEMDYLIQAAKGEIRLSGGTPMMNVKKGGAAPTVKHEAPAPQKMMPLHQPAAPVRTEGAMKPMGSHMAAQENVAPASSSVKTGYVQPIHSIKDLDAQRAAHSGITVLYIGTTWCGPCKKLKPVFNKLAGDMPEALFLMADGDTAHDITNRYLKHGFPNVVIFDKKGGVSNLLGYKPYEELRGEIEKALKNGAREVIYKPMAEPMHGASQAMLMMDEDEVMDEMPEAKSVKKSGVPHKKVVRGKNGAAPSNGGGFFGKLFNRQ